MESQPDQHLDPHVAANYDSSVAERFAPSALDPTVDLLAELAGDGPALEFAIGTGRVALPLAARGIEVHGIDQSEPMLAQLRAKPGGVDVAVTVGDMTSATTGRDDYTLVFLVFNTIGNVTTQDGQVSVFVNAAAHLAPGGRFVIETGVPSGPDAPPRVFAMDKSHVGIDEYVDPVDQIHASHHWFFDGDQVRQVSGRFRWAWPAELDLMARLAGLELEARWSDWHRGPFTGDSAQHVSVWRKPGAG